MRPHKVQKTERAAVAAAQTYLRAHLGWLRGFPIEGNNELQWMILPRLGRHAQCETLAVTRDLLRNTEYSRNAARRKFPRALTQVVGNVDDWSARIDVQLELLKAAIHSAASMPTIEVLLDAADVRRATIRQAMSLVRSQPALTSVVTGLVWLHWHNKIELEKALHAVQHHNNALESLLNWQKEMSGLVLVQRCIQLLTDECNNVLIDYMADRRIWEVPLSHGDLPTHLENVLKCFRKRRPFDKQVIASGFPRPAPRLGNDLVAFVERISTLDKTTRTRLCQLLPYLLSKGNLDEWEQWWQTVDVLERRSRSLLSHHKDPKHTRELAEQCKILEKEAKAALETPEVFKQHKFIEHAEIICRQASQTAFFYFLNCIQLLPDEEKNKSTKEIFLREWAEALRDSVGRISVVEQLLKAQCSLLQQLAHDPKKLTWAYKFLTRNLIYEWVDTEKAQSLIVPVVTTFRLLVSNVETWDENTGPFSDYSGWDTLIVAVETTGDAIKAADMLASVPPCYDGLYGKSWGLLLQLSQLYSVPFQALAKNWNDELWPWTSLKELSLLINEPIIAKLIAEWLANGEGTRLSRLIAISDINRRLGLSNEKHAVSEWVLPEDRCTTALDLTPYPAELHDVLKTLGLCDPNAAYAADRILSHSFPLPVHIHTELARLYSLAENSDSTRQAVFKARICHLEARLRAPLDVSPIKLAKYRAKLERRIRHAHMSNWEQRLNTQLCEYLTVKMGVQSQDWMQNDEIMAVLVALAELPSGIRNLGFRLLKTRRGPEPWDLRDEAPNRAFLDALERRGVNIAPWLDGIGSREIRTKTKILKLNLETDPLQIMRMGAPFETCLAPGACNFFSTVSNAADINKRILYVRDPKGGIQGRCLLALTDDGALVAFNVYAHADLEIIKKAVTTYVLELAETMGTVVTANGKVRELISTQWYDDGSIDLTGQLDFLRPSSKFVTTLATLPADELVPFLEQTLGSRIIPSSVICALAQQDAFYQRPELVLPLLPHIRTAATLQEWGRLRLVEMFHKAGKNDIALEILEPLILNIPYEGWEVSIAIQLNNIGQPLRALKLIRQSRPAWVKEWSDESGIRAMVAAKAMEALHRPRQALELYRIAAKVDPEATEHATKLERLLGE